jgi:peroxiredoxin (alkyl hydroperoxide reductase subunit C)
MSESEASGTERNDRVNEQRAQPVCMPMLPDPAPEFRARTTKGELSLSSYRGKWLLFFSHPADFTPVCTTELIAFAKNAERFRKANCELLALSLDGLYSHLAWERSIIEQFGVVIPFPIVEDPSMSIARAYGMIHPKASDSATVRGVFLIDPNGIIRAISFYPSVAGRNVEEILRLLVAIQIAESHHVLTPEGWQPGDDILLPPPTTSAAAEINARSTDARTWYFRNGSKKPKARRGTK